MTKPNITKGEWRVGGLESYDPYTGEPYRNVWCGEGENSTVVARAIRSEGAKTNDVDADAFLIAEAGTVYNETGLTPRELLGLARELRGAIDECEKDVNWMLSNRDFLNRFVFNYIDDALEKSEAIK